MIESNYYFQTDRDSPKAVFLKIYTVFGTFVGSFHPKAGQSTSK